MKSFTEIGLNNNLLEAINKLGFEEPTPIQAKTIPHLLSSDKDMIGLAQTGTGKTAAFGLPALHLTNIEDKRTQTLVLCPTRELCMQITKDLKTYAENIRGIGIVAVYGGASIDTQINALKREAQIVVGTPGRIKDLINRRRLMLGNVERVVLDEADEMLSMGFQEDLDEILSKTSDTKQTLLFSATMSKEVSKITKKYMSNAVEISVAAINIGAENVKHLYYMVQARDKYEVLKRIADINPKIYGIVFCRTRRETKEIANKLMTDGYNADALHGDLSQPQRDEVMGRFRQGQLQLLVATDVAARGLDVHDLTHIINFNLPDDSEIYIHRSGRTGRAGKSGTSIAIIHSRDGRRIREIEKLAGIKFTKELVPSGKDICSKQLYSLIDRIEKVEVDEKQIEPFLSTIYQKLEWLSREELIKHFVSSEFNRFLSYYKNAKDMNFVERDRGNRNDNRRDWKENRGDRKDNRGERKDNRRDRNDREERHENKGEWKDKRRASTGFSRLYINVGERHNLNPASLIGLVNDGLRSRDAEIGKIDILRNFSFFEVEEGVSNQLINSLKGKEFEGIKLSVELSQEKPSFTPSPKSKPSWQKRDFGNNKPDWKKDKDRRSGSGSSRSGGSNRSGGSDSNRKNYRKK